MDVADLTVKVVDAVDGDWKAAGVIVHDQTNRGLAHMLVEMPEAGFPVALGVLFDNPAPTFESAVIEQNRAASEGKVGDLQKLLAKGQTWQVEKEPHVIRSEEHTSELQSLMRTSYAVFCCQKTNNQQQNNI